VEPEPYLRGLAEVAAGRTPVLVRVVDGTADDLPAPEGSMDAVVASLALCSVPEQARALESSIGCCGLVGSCASSSTSEPTPPAWPGSSDSPTSSGPPWWAAATPAATPWPPSPPPASGSRASSGSGSPRAGYPNQPHPTSSGSPTSIQPLGKGQLALGARLVVTYVSGY
jgi:hypothetical protein